MPFPSANRSRASVDISRADERRASVLKRRDSISAGAVVGHTAAAAPASAVKVTAPSSSSSSSPSKWQAATMSRRLLPPPETPTRRLLQRIQRRSSTSAESIVLASKPAARATPTSTSITPSSLRQVRQNPDAKDLGSFGVRRDSLSGQRPDVSTMSLPRHARTRSLLAVNAATKTLPHSKVAISVAVEKYITSAEPSMPLPSGVSVPFSTSPTSVASTAKLDDESMPSPDHVTLPDEAHSSKAATTVPDVGKDNLTKENKQSSDVPLQCSPTAVAHEPLPSSSPTGSKSVPIIDPRTRAEMLREATTHGTGLTRDAARSLEQEFSSQERILQGLQRDNERKTVEVEEMRRQKARLEEFCARYFGAEHWRDVVFGTAEQSRSAIKRGNDETSVGNDGKAGHETPQQHFMTAKSSLCDLDDQSCSSQAIVEGLLRTLSSPSVTSQLSSPSAAPAQRTPMFSTPSHRSSAPTRASTLSRPRTPPSRNAVTAGQKGLPFDSSVMSAVDDVSFASALDASTVIDEQEDDDENNKDDAATALVRVPRAALQAVVDAQRQLLLAVQAANTLI